MVIFWRNGAMGVFGVACVLWGMLVGCCSLTLSCTNCFMASESFMNLGKLVG